MPEFSDVHTVESVATPVGFASLESIERQLAALPGIHIIEDLLLGLRPDADAKSINGCIDVLIAELDEMAVRHSHNPEVTHACVVRVEVLEMLRAYWNVGDHQP